MRVLCRSLLAFAATTVCSTSIAPIHAQSAALTERQFVDEVTRVGLAARIADAELALARAEGVGAGAWPNPSLTWQRESLPGSGAQPGASQDILALSAPLVLSGRLGLEREAARKGAAAAELRRARALGELRFEAIRRFHAAVAAGERVAVLARSLETVQRLADSIAARERAGDASGYDRLRIALEAATLRDLRSQAEIDERSARSEALLLLSPERGTLPTLVADPAGGGTRARDRQALAEQAAARRADLAALRLEREAADHARAAASRGWVPELRMTGGAQVTDAGRPGSRTGYVVGVELPLPLFQRRQGEQARAAAQADVLAARQADLTRQLRLRLGALIEQSAQRRKRLEDHRREILSRAEELQRIATAAYRGGASDLLVLVDAERSAREARLAAVDLARAAIDADNELLLLAGLHDGQAMEGTRR